MFVHAFFQLFISFHRPTKKYISLENYTETSYFQWFHGPIRSSSNCLIKLLIDNKDLEKRNHQNRMKFKIKNETNVLKL